MLASLTVKDFSRLQIQIFLAPGWLILLSQENANIFASVDVSWSGTASIILFYDVNQFEKLPYNKEMWQNRDALSWKNAVRSEGWRETFLWEVKAIEIEKENIKCLISLQSDLIWFMFVTASSNCKFVL